MSEKFDVIVIGAGQAGPALAVRCGKEKLKTAIIERHRFGGTCVNNGCIPTKALIASAHAAHVARRAGDYGVMIDASIRTDMARVKARKDEIVRKSREGVRSWLDNADNVTVIEGHARFTSPNTIQVGDRTLTAAKIFIDVGARAAKPDIKGLDQVPYLNNEGMMHIDRLPEHLLVVGGSYIGLEFAQMYRRFGSEVTVVEMAPRLIAREDEDISDAVREILEKEGIQFRLSATCLEVSKSHSGVTIGVDCKAGSPQIEGSHLLLATGRTPNTHDLGLDAAGIATDKRGYIEVNEHLATAAKGVYALGECNGRGAFTHTSYNDFEIVAANLFDRGDRKVSDRIMTYALFTDPPLGRVGMTDTQVRDSGRKALFAKYPMSRVGRAREMGETEGFMKISVDAESKRILGAAILGVHGDEVIQAILEVMAADKPYTVITDGMHIHPTVAELVPTMLGDLKPA